MASFETLLLKQQLVGMQDKFKKDGFNELWKNMDANDAAGIKNI